MFSPTVNTTLPSATPTLVATTLPKSNALRVPYDNVAPSVSSAQLDNNASANRGLIAKTNAQPPAPANNQAGNIPHPQENASLYFSASAQSAFIAQLASGDISAEVHGIFIQYEKLVSYANVKYKPSNAGKPADNTGLFKSLLQPGKNSAPPATVAASQPDLPPASPTPVNTEAEIAAKTRETADAEPAIAPRLSAYNAAIARNHDITIREKAESA